MWIFFFAEKNEKLGDPIKFVSGGRKFKGEKCRVILDKKKETKIEEGSTTHSPKKIITMGK